MADSVVNFLTDKLTSTLLQKLTEEVSLVVTFKEDFESICDELVHIKCLLNDARDKTGSQSMTNWLRQLKDFLNDAMDIVEEFEGSDNFCVSIFPYFMGRKIKDLKKRINQINATGSKYLTYLTSFVDVNASSEEERRNSSSHLLRKEEEPVGIQDEIDAITEEILKENAPVIIAIVGTGGQGKTRLVQHVFNNERVEKRFRHRVWLSVSQKIDIEHLLHDIAEQIQLPGDELTIQLPGDDHHKLTVQLPKDYHKKLKDVGTEGLRDRIQRHLKGQREPSLFVFDDVWHKDILQWIGLELQSQINKKNKIIVTTRDKGVSNSMGAQIYQMKYLSDEERMELFCIHAFQDLAYRKLPEDLECFRYRILEKCTKLPMAVEAIGTSMAGARRIPNHWEAALGRVRKANVINEQLMPTLRLSFNALPYNLKACFLYFASFPPDTPVKSECLVYAWLAIFREFVPAGVQAVNVAWSYIDQLVDRCVIQASRIGADGRVKYCVMHDFFHIFALSESHKEAKCLLKPGEDLKHLPVGDCKDARRISLAKNDIEAINETMECSSLRILLLFENSKLKSISSSFFKELRHLAVLDLSRTQIKSLPSSVGNLQRLKFLNLSGTKIEKLPKFLSGLGSLQFLDVSNCQDLRRLHSGIGKNKSMLHLNVKGCNKLEFLPSGISKLGNSLQTLKLKGVLFKPAASSFGWVDFSDLSNLQHLSITFNRDSISKEFYWPWTLGAMRKMRILSLQYDDSLQGPLRRESDDRCETFGDRCPVPRGVEWMEHLEILRLSKCRLLVPRPDWMFQLHNLMVLVLHGDDSSSADDYKGLEKIVNLRKLRLCSNEKCRSFPAEFGEPHAFPKLKNLIIEDFYCLENLPTLQDKAMPTLMHLEIKNCMRLKHIPEGLENLKSLEELELDKRLEENLLSGNSWQTLNTRKIKIKFFDAV